MWTNVFKTAPVATITASLTAGLDKFMRDNPSFLHNRAQMLLEFLKSEPNRQASVLLEAELTYLRYAGEQNPILYDPSTQSWHVWGGRWENCSQSTDRVAAILQSDFRKVVKSASNLANATDQATETLQKLHCKLEKRASSTDALIHEMRMFFARDPAFDRNAYIFQLENCVLDLRENTFRMSQPSDMTQKYSPVRIPAAWLRDPSLITYQSKGICEKVEEVMWGIYKREGDFHPSDHFEEVGDNDAAEYMHLLQCMARMMEGIPLQKVIYFFSHRGRNSKGMLEKAFKNMWGSY